MKLGRPVIAIGAVAALLLPLNAATHGTTYAAASCSNTVVLRIAGWSGADQESSVVQAGLSAFGKANPCIKAYYQPIVGNYQQKIQTEFASGNEPDVFFLSPDMMAAEGKAGKLLDLKPFLAKDNVPLSRYVARTLTPFEMNGHVYALPKDWDTVGVFYNKAMFDAKKLPYPSNNWTFADFEKDVKALYTPSSNPSKVIYGTLVPPDAYRLIPFMYGFGAKIMDVNNGKVLFNTPQAIQALDFYTGLQTKDHAAVQPSVIGDGWQGDSFGKGRVAMVVEGGWLNPTMQTNYSKIRYGVAQFPAGPAGRIVPQFTNGWAADAALAKTPASAAAAVKFIEYFTGPAYQTQVLHSGFALPTISALQSNSYLKSHGELGNLFASANNLGTGNYLQYDSQMTTALGNAITSVLLGKQTPAQAIPAAAKTLQSQITNIP